jgi:hypothetical protein
LPRVDSIHTLRIAHGRAIVTHTSTALSPPILAEDQPAIMHG